MDIVARLRGTPLWRHSTPPSRELEESDLGLEAADEIERLRTALQRIDGINDNPAIYNPDIEAVLRAALDEQVAQ